ncbi:MAG: epoxyqueuosine reductase [Deltaproteobacteria bacterium]|nr:epoxyqueuosine reductase [Deltaproteobacteria bacterium]MBW2415665.1 epoxyqueuosine reductase [Deltaproteobacteria bacterium]
MESPKERSEFAIDFLKSQGAVAVGISTVETLAGGPPSTDLEYVLEGAKSAVTFALPFDQEKVLAYLAKKDHGAHQADNFMVNNAATGLAVNLASYWSQRGVPSFGVCSNIVYRTDTPGGMLDFKPDLSHRYLAARSGVGWFGFSGNVITETHGAGVILGTTVTTAELVATDPLPAEDKYCDECQLCLASCSSGLFGKDETSTVTMGGQDFSYSKRKSYRRCDMVCGGFTGLSKNGKWSTWSPGRFPVPDAEEDCWPALGQAVQASAPRPAIDGGFYHPAMQASRRINITCANCQLICHPDRDERKRRYQLITTSGVVIQHEDGSLEAVSPEAAEKHLAAMSTERRATYTKD